MNKRIICIVLALIFMLALCSCTQKDSSNDKLSIVTTNFPAYDFARAVAGENADITMLLSPGEESHTFDPTPAEMIEIQNCDLFICVGGESDEWVETLLSSNDYASVHVLRMIKCVDALEEELKEGMQSEEEHDSEHEEAEYDEHVWTSPLNVISIINKIKDELCIIDSSNKSDYENNCTEYTKQLTSIDKEFKSISAKIPNKTLIFADRFPFRYFAEEYGFDYYAAFPGCSSETEPSVSTITFLIDKVKNEEVPAIFCIELSNRSIADSICNETNTKQYTLHSCHNISKEDFSNGITYIDLMQRNIETLKEAYGI